MSQVLTPNVRDVHELDATTATRVLAEAIAAQTRVRILVSTSGVETPVSGKLVGGDESTLEIELHDAGAVNGLLLPSSLLHVTLESSKTHYVFETTLAPGHGRRHGRLCIERPNTLATMERRRAVRTALRDPMPITLRAEGEGQADSWQCTGDVFNVSHEGLACRVRESDAAILTRARKVRASFRIGNHPQAFDLACRITNVTQGSTAHQVVLGIAFVHADNPAGTPMKLRAALACAY